MINKLLKMKLMVILLAGILFFGGCVQQSGPPETETSIQTTIEKTIEETTTLAEETTTLAEETTTLAECSRDSDCATGGCSSQVCGVRDKVKGIVTTCEWREEYSCLKKTVCGCVDGSCRWKETEEYRECMSRIGREVK